MLECVIDNFNVRVAGVIKQRGAWMEHFINYWEIEEKNRTFCKCFYVLKLLVVPHRWRKFRKKISSTVENMANQNCSVFCGPLCRKNSTENYLGLTAECANMVACYK